MRNFAFERWANNMAQNLTQQNIDLLTDYVDGINEWATRHTLPLEYHVLRLDWKNWTITDTLTVSKLMEFHLTTNWGTEIYTEFLRSRFDSEDIIEKILPFEEKNFAYYTTNIMNDDELKQMGLYKGREEKFK